LDNLENIRPTPDEDGLIATMPDGLASIFVVRNEPGDVRLEVEPWEGEPGVVGDDLLLGFRAVDDFTLVFEGLPAPGPEGGYRAGEAVPVRARAFDAFGRPVTRPVAFTLVAECSFWLDTITFEGEEPTEFELIPKRVCDSDRIIEITGAVDGASEPFSVVAGEATSFEIFGLQPSPVVAGDSVRLDVLAVDGFGNRTAYPGSLVATAPDAEPLSAECVPPGGPGLTRQCTLVPAKVGTGLLVEVTDDSGMLRGSRSDLTVVPRPEPVQAGITIASSTVAGEPFGLSIQPYDPYGNLLDASGFPTSTVLVTDELDEIACVRQVSPPGSTALLLDCRLFTSRAGARVAVSFPGTGAGPFGAPQLDVEPADFSQVRIEAPATAVAGELVPIELIALDDFGNEVVPPANPSPHGVLVDATGTFSAAAVFLSSSRASVQGVFVQAGETLLTFDVQGQTLGTSEPLLVLPAAAIAWRIETEAWAFTGEPSLVRVRAEDTFGNTSPVDTDLSVMSVSGAFLPFVWPVVDGEASFPVTFEVKGDPQMIEVVDREEREGTASVTVVEACADGGPSAAVGLVGTVGDRLCLDPVTLEGTVTVDPLASMAGTAPLDFIVVTVDGEPLARQRFPAPSDRPDVVLAGSGQPEVALLVVDVDLCADVAISAPWTGPDDGTATGPVLITTPLATIGDIDLVDLDVLNVTDCRSQPASFAELSVRTTAGELLGVAPTGHGLTFTLDGQGNGQIQVQTQGDLQAGILSVYAFTDSGSAAGRMMRAIVGDSIPPVITDQSPTGSVEAGLVDSIVLRASEALSSSSVDAAVFEVIGPAGPLPLDEVSLDEDGRMLRVTLLTPVDQGQFEVIVGPTLTDRAGNGLAGGYAMVPEAYEGGFGFDAPPAALEVACDPGAVGFRPDGDPGVGVEADTISVTATVGAIPRWWTFDVSNALGERVRHLRRPATGLQEALEWDGRDQAGIVVSPGRYVIDVGAEDGLGQRARSCQVEIRVEQGPRGPT
ncbi:MAG: Ig-like domain-containing protein, partial [Myxococcota bacterium]